MINSKSLFFLLLTISLFQFSCEKENSTISDCDDAPASFTTDVAPILNSSCNTTGCHNSGNENGDFTTYSGIKVKANDGSLMNTVITNKTMPLASTLTEEQLNKFKCWLDSNAPNN